MCEDFVELGGHPRSKVHGTENQQGSVRITDPDELRVRLAQIRRTNFGSLDATRAGWPAIGALINGEAARLMYVRHEGDAGFSTRNPQYVGPEKASLSITCRMASAMSTRRRGTSHRRSIARPRIFPWRGSHVTLAPLA